jgi:gamma-glutamylcyclotransferase (GGCT)/AIG2-like uncharacterized protein YtfP
MPLYFAYGANMDVEDMARRCPRSRPLGLARLMRHRLAIMREGWLTAARDPRGRVHGVLWDLALADVSALDRFEDLADGLYAKAAQPVIAAGGPKRALVYFGANAGPGRADAAYIVAVIAAARRWRLPEDGLAALERFAREAGVGGADAAAPRVRPRFATPFER